MTIPNPTGERPSATSGAIAALGQDRLVDLIAQGKPTRRRRGVLASLLSAAYFAARVELMVAILFIAGVLLFGLIPPMFAALQNVCGGSRRAMAVAIAFFFGVTPGPE